MSQCECHTTVGSYPGGVVVYCIRDEGHQGDHMAELWFPDADCEHADHDKASRETE